jgi:rhodanese-related sulfurtransferase
MYLLYLSIIVFITFGVLIYRIKPQLVTKQTKKSSHLLIDVRTKPEWLRNHLPNSINIPYDQLDTLDVDRDTEVVVYCNSGKRAKMAKETLSGLGYRDVELLLV